MLGEICFHAYGPKKLNKKQLGTSKVIQIAHALSLSLSLLFWGWVYPNLRQAFVDPFEH
jgi:hypothetical protein